MKYRFAILFYIFTSVSASPCENQGRPLNEERGKRGENLMTNKIKIMIGNRVFLATLQENPSASAFKAMLPLTMKMSELNGNEKYFELSKDLPTNASNPETINSGDLMLWGSNTVVLFYDTFATSYSYSRLGKVDNPTGLADALGTGNVTVTIELR